MALKPQNANLTAQEVGAKANEQVVLLAPLLIRLNNLEPAT
jgi:hypothetical protein